MGKECASQRARCATSVRVSLKRNANADARPPPPHSRKRCDEGGAIKCRPDARAVGEDASFSRTPQPNRAVTGGGESRRRQRRCLHPLQRGEDVATSIEGDGASVRGASAHRKRAKGGSCTPRRRGRGRATARKCRRRTKHEDGAVGATVFGIYWAACRPCARHR